MSLLIELIISNVSVKQYCVLVSIEFQNWFQQCACYIDVNQNIEDSIYAETQSCVLIEKLLQAIGVFFS